MQFELTQDYINQLKVAVAERDDYFIQGRMEELHVQDIAPILMELDDEESYYLFKGLDFETGAQVLREIDPDYRKHFVKQLSIDELADYIEYQESDDAADIINEQPVKTGEEIIALLEDREKAGFIRDLLHYDEDCAGGLMAKELIKANINWNVKQCIEEIRRQSRNVEQIYSIYVIDNSNKLLGRVSVKRILLAEDDTLIADIYESEIISVESYRDAQEVAEVMRKYDLEVIPVVNVQGKLLGRITIDDIVDVITEKAEEDIQMMAGISGSTDEDDSVWVQSKSRLPWLLIGMLGGILGARFIGLFENFITLVPTMAFFIPLITATGGNVGIQSSSVIVQDLARDSGPSSFTMGRFFKGFIVAVVNGVAIAGIVLLFNTVLGEEMKQTIVVSVALFSVVILASFTGTMTPLILEKVGVNPALAAGPFITTANDLLGLAIYFTVAHYLYLI